MELTKQLIKFCCKNLLELKRLEGSDVWEIRRRACSRLFVFRHSMWMRLKQLGLHKFSTTDDSPDGLEERLTAIKALADAGSIEALEDLCNLAMIAAKGVQNVERMIYLRDHPSDLPWKKKAAEQFGVACARSSPSQIEDAEVNSMLADLGKRMSNDGPAGQQEGLNA